MPDHSRWLRPQSASGWKGEVRGAPGSREVVGRLQLESLQKDLEAFGVLFFFKVLIISFYD